MLAPIQPPPPPPLPTGFDPCAGQPPIDKLYSGLLRNARCDQERFLTMAGIAKQLGVECQYCHVASAQDPSKLDYVTMTPRKEIANWMGTQLMGAIKLADGGEATCSSCHVDAKSKPAAKFLGEPRNLPRTHEWMAMIMVNRFQTRGGDRLRCKSCHGANYGQPTFLQTVILKSDQLPR